MSDQTIKADAGKPRLSLVPTKIIEDIARVREYGVAKYSTVDGWKRVEKDRYKDAAYRHFIAYLDNPKSIDEESGYPHLWHLACNIAFLCSLEEETVPEVGRLLHPEKTVEMPTEVTTEPETTEFDWEEMKKLMKEKSEQKTELPELDCKITDSELYKEFIEYKNMKARKEMKQ